MPCRLSHGNDADFIVVLGMGDYGHRAPNQAESDKTLFPVVETVILEGAGYASKDLYCIEEIEAMLEEVGSALVFVPGEFHVSMICGITQLRLELDDRRLTTATAGNFDMDRDPIRRHVVINVLPHPMVGVRGPRLARISGGGSLNTAGRVSDSIRPKATPFRNVVTVQGRLTGSATRV